VELPDEIFSDIAGVAVIDPVYDLPHERRAHPRVAFGGRARIAPLFDTMSNRGMPVLLRDISTAGIGFLCQQRLDDSDEFIICLRSKSDKLIKIHCIVRRCDPGGVGLTQFDIGATFEQVLGVVMDAATSAAAVTQAAIGDISHSGGPIRRFLIRPVARSSCAIWSAIKTYRDSSRIRRRLKRDRRNKKTIEQPNAPVIEVPAAPERSKVLVIDQAAAASPLPPPQIGPFVPRAGGLFQTVSSIESPSAAEPAPTPDAPKQTSAASAVEPSVPAAVIQETPVITAENPPAPCKAEFQLEIPWTSEPVATTPPDAAELPAQPTPAAPQPIEISEAEAPAPQTAVIPTPVAEPIESEAKFDKATSTEPAPEYRTNTAVLGLLKNRQTALARHPRRRR
jgi:hypothetical protein